MDKSGAKFKFVGHSTEIIWQSKNKGTLQWYVVEIIPQQISTMEMGAF